MLVTMIPKAFFISSTASSCFLSPYNSLALLNASKISDLLVPSPVSNNFPIISSNWSLLGGKGPQSLHFSHFSHSGHGLSGFCLHSGQSLHSGHLVDGQLLGGPTSCIFIRYILGNLSLIRFKSLKTDTGTGSKVSDCTSVSFLITSRSCSDVWLSVA